MDIKKVLSIAIASSLMVSVFSHMTIIAEETTVGANALDVMLIDNVTDSNSFEPISDYVDLFKDEFSTDVAVATGTGTAIGSNWKILNQGGVSTVNQFSVEDGQLKIYQNRSDWAGNPSVVSTATELNDIKIGDTIKVDLGFETSNNAYDVVGERVGAYARVYLTADESTYYEFGYSDTDGKVSGENTAPAEFLPYLRLVENGIQTSIDYDEDNENGVIKTNFTVGDRLDEYSALKTFTFTLTEDGAVCTAAGSDWTFDAACESTTQIAPDSTKISFGVYGGELSDRDSGTMLVDNVNLVKAREISLFTDDFSSYTSQNALIAPTRFPGTVSGDKSTITVAECSEGDIWKSSAKKKGNFISGLYWGHTYVDADNDTLCLRGHGRYPTTVNLEINENLLIDRYTKIEFTTTAGSYPRDNEYAGAALFTSEDELYCIELRQNIKTGIPTVAKLVNTIGGVYDFGTTLATASDSDGWSSADKSVSWKVEISEENALRVTAVGSNGAKSQWIIDDSDVKYMITNCKYPISALARTEGYDTSYQKLSSVNVWYELSAGFGENFSEYNSDNSVSSSYNMANGKKAMGVHSSGASWITSAVYDGSHHGTAYIDTTSNALALKGWGTYHLASVNLHTGAKKWRKPSGVMFKSTMSGARMMGATLFSGGNEKNFVLFGQRTEECSLWNDNTKEYEPFVIKRIEGMDTYIGEYNLEKEWSSSDTEIIWTISIDNNNNITWSAIGNNGGKSNGTICDDDVKALITSNWEYPFSAITTGDYVGYINSVKIKYPEEYTQTYEAKNYTLAEFKELYNWAEYGRDDDVEKLLSLDLSDINEETAVANVSITTQEKALSDILLGAQIEFQDQYDWFYNDYGELKEDYIRVASNSAPIPSFRMGGASSNEVNFLKSIKGEASTYLSADELPPEYASKAGQPTAAGTNGVMKMGLNKWINACLVNNPEASFVLCISMLTTTPEESAELIKLLTGTDAEDSSARARYGLPSEPINIIAVELNNEIEHWVTQLDARGKWYAKFAKLHIDKIKYQKPDIKIIACGRTTPWDAAGAVYKYTGRAMDATTAWKTWLGYIAQIGEHIDAISFHPYYVNGNSFSINLLDYTTTMKNYFDVLLAARGIEKDVKFAVTEHANGWKGEYGFMPTLTTDLKAGLDHSFFISCAAFKDTVESAYSHCLVNAGFLWGRWLYDGAWHETPLSKTYTVLGEAWGEKALANTVSFTSGGTASGTEQFFGVIPVKASENELRLILTNKWAYKDINLTFDLPEEYMLVNEKILTAPNIYSYTFNDNCENLTQITSAKMHTEKFSSYVMPAKSVAVLTLVKNGVEYKVNDSGVDMKLYPSYYGEESVDVMVAYYDSDKQLAKVEKDTFTENATLFSVKNPLQYSYARIFLWDENMRPVQSDIMLE